MPLYLVSLVDQLWQTDADPRIDATFILPGKVASYPEFWGYCSITIQVSRMIGKSKSRKIAGADNLIAHRKAWHLVQCMLSDDTIIT